MGEAIISPLPYGRLLKMIEVGKLLADRYKITSKIGHGGMSEVYEARDIIFRRPVAVKMLSLDASSNIENVIRFQNEARIASALNHPNIVKIYDFGSYYNTPYIVNEYMKSQTLKDTIDFKKSLPLYQALRITSQLLDAACYLHEKNIIHRDIKPQNIFYGSDEIVKLADFGISIVLNASLNINENKRVVGTAQYLAPELVRGKKPSFQSDIYAIGITFYELLTGEVPFDDGNVNKIAFDHIKKDIPSPLKTMPTLPKSVEKIIFKATNKDLDLRYKTAKEMQKDIIKLLNNKNEMKKNRGFFSRFFGLSAD